MITDVNVSLSRWPCRRLPLDDSARLVAELSQLGVTQAWAGSFDALLHNDVAAVNQRLAEDCRTVGADFLLPFGAVNLALPQWEDDVKRCAEIHGMPGIRLLPGYHDYGFSDERFATMLRLADEARLIVQIAVRLEDPRTQHRLLSAADVDLRPLLEVLPDHPRLPIVLLNCLSNADMELHSQLAAAGNVSFDIATLEGLTGLERLVKSIPPERILYGSHAPFFVADSPKLKLQESALPAPITEQITHGNASKLLATVHSR